MNHRRLSEKDMRLIEAILKTMAEDLAEVVEQYGLGACMVRAFDNGHGIAIVGKAHERTIWGATAPSELISIRKEAGR